MKEYQRQKNKYILPGTMYMQTIYQIRDYYRLKEEAESILHGSPAPADGQPHGSSTPGSVVERKAERRERNLEIVAIIDRAKELLPEEYRIGVWNNIMYHNPFPMDADRSTYGRYKSLFVYSVAKEIFYLD